LEEKPKEATHGSTRSMAAKVGVGQTTIGRIWRAFGLQSHRAESFELSTDTFFVEDVGDEVGLYPDPPERAVMLCVVEKSQIRVPSAFQSTLVMRGSSPLAV